MSKLINDYNKVVQEYIDRFCEKQDLEFEFWVADQVGSIASFGDILCFNFLDIVWDINSEQPKGLIIDWAYETLDNLDYSINYYTYSKGLRYDN